MSWVDERGIHIDPPRTDEPVDEDSEIKATILIWNDLHQAGVPLRDIAGCFSVDFTVVFDYLKQIPEEVKSRHATKEYMGRLGAAVAESRRPGTRLDVRSILEAVLSTNLLRHPSL